MAQPNFLADTRAFYDALAEDYQHLMGTTLDHMVVERSVLAQFAGSVGGGRVADVGSGPGRVTAHLAERGVDCVGIDLSPVMVAIARRAFPALRFSEGSMTALDLPDGSLSGLLAWYSLIHVPPADRPAVLGEFRRMLTPGGYLQLGFQVGDDGLLNVVAPDGRLGADGSVVGLDFHRLSPGRISVELATAGFAPVALTIRQPRATEKVPQAFILARRR